MKIHLILLVTLAVATSAPLCDRRCTCPSTTVASCSNLNLQELPNGTFDVRVQHLDYSYNKLSSLDNDMISGLRVTALVNVNFSHNIIDEIEMMTFRGETRLKQLDLSWNRIRFFNRRTLKYMPSLEKLSLAGNTGIQLIPSGYFLESTSLQYLNMASCELGFIPDNTFGDVPNLRSLDLSHNRITKLGADAFPGLAHLEHLDLSYNYLDSEQLEQLTKSLANKVNIVKGPQRVSPCSWSTDDLANCSHQGLTELLPVRFNNFTHHVDLSYNKLTNLTRESVNTLRGVKDLYSLNFSHNLIDNIDEDALADGLWIKNVDLSWNRLSSIRPTTFQHNYYIERLSLAGNVEFILDPYENFINAWHLKHLNLSQCSLTDIPNKSFKNVYHLQSLDVSHNELITLHSESLFGINDLEILDLSYNQLQNISSGVLSGLSKLKFLDLSNNLLTTLDDNEIKPLINLHTFYIRNNKLQTLPITLLEALQKDGILIRGNRQKRDTVTKTLEVAGNPWNCDCNMQKAYKWCETNKVSLNVTCQSPDTLSHKDWFEVTKLECKYERTAMRDLNNDRSAVSNVSPFSALGFLSFLTVVFAVQAVLPV